jgi:xylitol oxidase
LESAHQAIHLNLNGRLALLPEINRNLAELERALVPFGARPHWAKLVSITPTGEAEVFTPALLRSLYGEKLQRFYLLAAKHDPTGKFKNKWVTSLLGMDR